MTLFLFSLAGVVAICGGFTYFLYLGEIRAEKMQQSVDRMRERYENSKEE
jgi:drug/metabolite transporter superfamily protein YnfA